MQNEWENGGKPSEKEGKFGKTVGKRMNIWGKPTEKNQQPYNRLVIWVTKKRKNLIFRIFCDFFIANCEQKRKKINFWGFHLLKLHTFFSFSAWEIVHFLSLANRIIG
jgi:hypothetical protein